MSRFVLVNRYFYPDESATSQLLTDLAQHLASRHQVVVLASRQLLEDAQARLPAFAVGGGARIHRVWSTSLGRRWLPGRLLDHLSFLGAVLVWLVLHVRRGDVVLAKTDPPLLGVVTTLATLGRGARRIQWLQDLYPEIAVHLDVLAEGPLAAMVRGLRNWSLRHSTLVVAVSRAMRDDLQTHVGRTPLVHIPNWADDFAPPVAIVPATGAMIVGYSGNLGLAHPIGGLLELAERAIDSSLQFLVSGGGANHERLCERVRQLGCANWTFLPYQPRERLGDLLRRSSVHLVILDPRVERCVFPSKLYGILSAGRPVLHLGDPNGELGRLLREHGCGWSVSPDSGVAILEALRDLQAHPDRLQAAGSAARNVYQSRYSRAEALRRWDAALQTV